MALISGRRGRDGPARGSLLYDARFRGLVFQLVVLVAVAALIAFIVDNTVANLHKRGIASGFSFLWATSGFDIGLRLIPYDLTSTYGRAFLVGLINTLVVSVCSIVLATILGLFLGVLRLSRNWLVARLAAVYLETVRNIPLLLQILFWYFGVLTALPPLRQSLEILFGTVFINNRGVYTPRPILLPGAWVIPVALGVGIVAAVALYRWAKARQDRTGAGFPAVRVGLLIVVGLPVIAAAAAGFPVEWQLPVLKGFNFSGGMMIPPEFVGLLLALTLYTAAFIGEIVRAGILSVSHGQTEAAYALGLKPGSTLRLVVIPQALRVIVPPLTSQYLNITKNSSLAVAIGYPDLVSVFTGTVLNQTGQAVEVIFITMMVYMTISLIISALMNWYNRRIALVER
ncbi:MAG: amino acid ABC transporter permease [Rhodospirillaceae bacterium]|nr:amino acid ABC transporter permease [Rhodospirillaceae bacterium]